MEDSIQFHYNIKENSNLNQNLSGKYIIFQLNEDTEELQIITNDSFLIFNKNIIAEWLWNEERCIICYSPIDPETHLHIWKCPHFAKIGHYDHVISWLERKQKCPVCRQPVYI